MNIFEIFPSGSSSSHISSSTSPSLPLSLLLLPILLILLNLHLFLLFSSCYSTSIPTTEFYIIFFPPYFPYQKVSPSSSTNQNPSNPFLLPSSNNPKPHLPLLRSTDRWPTSIEATPPPPSEHLWASSVFSGIHHYNAAPPSIPTAPAHRRPRRAISALCRSIHALPPAGQRPLQPPIPISCPLWCAMPVGLLPVASAHYCNHMKYPFGITAPSLARKPLAAPLLPPSLAICTSDRPRSDHLRPSAFLAAQASPLPFPSRDHVCRASPSRVLHRLLPSKVRRLSRLLCSSAPPCLHLPCPCRAI